MIGKDKLQSMPAGTGLVTLPLKPAGVRTKQSQQVGYSEVQMSNGDYSTEFNTSNQKSQSIPKLNLVPQTAGNLADHNFSQSFEATVVMQNPTDRDIARQTHRSSKKSVTFKNQQFGSSQEGSDASPDARDASNGLLRIRTKKILSPYQKFKKRAMHRIKKQEE